MNTKATCNMFSWLTLTYIRFDLTYYLADTYIIDGAVVLTFSNN